MPGPTPTTTFHGTGPGNVYIPAAQGQMQVEFSRNPASFPIARYAQIIPTSKLTGYYPEWRTEDANRVVTTNDHVWADGSPRPKQESRTLKWRIFDCLRHAYGFSLGGLTVGQADVDVIGANARGKAQICMTERVVEAITLLETAGTWGGNTAATVDALLSGSGTSWGGATATNPYIKQSFQAVKQAVAKSTGGVVRGNSLMCVVDPVTAESMAGSAEIHDYLTDHAAAMANLQMDGSSILNDYGLPPILYNVQMVVEDTVKTSTRRDEDGSTDTTGFAMSSNKAVFVHRPGGPVGPSTVEGDDGMNRAVPTNATLLMFAQEDMSVETKEDDWNRLTEGSVVDTRDFAVSSPAAGYLIQDTST